MHPTVAILGRVVSSYLLVLVFALLASASAFVALAPRLAVLRRRAAWIGGTAILFGLLGAKLQSVLLETGLGAWLARPSLGHGFAEQGGMLLGGVALVSASRGFRVPTLALLDLAAVSAALGLSIGRVGCLLAGCCFGRPTLFPIALVYSSFESPARPVGVPLHATPIYASAACMLIFCHLAFYRLSHRRYRGQLVVELGVLYAAQRFLLETLRADPRGPFLLGLSSPQLLALLFAILAAGARLVLARSSAPIRGGE
jgi:phosphatidylglycerol:prolipoprotein diacylglycerol transferase